MKNFSAVIVVSTALFAGNIMAQDEEPVRRPPPQQGEEKELMKTREGGPGFFQNRRESREKRPEGEDMEQRGDEMIERLLSSPAAAEETGLSEEKIKALKDGLMELKKKLVDLRAEMEKAAMDQAELLSNKELNEEAIFKAIETTGKIRTEIAKTQIKRMLLIKQNVSPEQIEKIKEKLRERRKKAAEEENRGNVRPNQERGRERVKEFREKRRDDRSEGNGQEGERPPPPPPEE